MRGHVSLEWNARHAVQCGVGARPSRALADALKLKTSHISPGIQYIDIMSTTRLPRTTPFTPQRPASVASMSSSHSTTSTSSLLSTAKKYRAPISTESRSRTISKPRPASSVPSTPLKKTHDLPRPKTPNTPRGRDTDSPMLRPLSSMDIRSIDPEEALVDFQTVDMGDISVDVDESFVDDISEHGSKDKVLVSIRYVARKSNHMQHTHNDATECAQLTPTLPGSPWTSLQRD
jgi:centromeric protein E